MNVLDLFSGACGGWSLGLHRAGMRTVAACEIDDWRRAVYGANFPGVRLYTDIRELTAERLRGDGVGPIDLVAGSPPCQDASTANTNGRGVDGAETGLFFEAVRLIGEIRPRWVALENVPGIRARGIDRVLEQMEAIGYACWPLVVGADDAGAPHRRKRLWLIGADADRVELWQQSGRRGGTNGASAAEPPGDAEHALQQGRGARREAQEAEASAFGLAAERTTRECRDDDGNPARERRRARRPKRRAYPTEGLPDRARRDAADAGGARSPLRQGEREDDGEQFATVERDDHDGGVDADPDIDRQPDGAVDGEMGGCQGAGSADDEPWRHWNAGPRRHLRLADGIPAELAGWGRIVSAYGDAIVPQIAEAIGRAILEIEQEAGR